MTTSTLENVITYKELQAWAKDNGIKANQSQAVLSQLHAEHFAPQVEVNPFEAYLPTQSAQPMKSNNAFPPSEKVLTYLTDLRTRFRRSLDGLGSISYQEAQKEINELRALPAPASDKQLEIIAQTIKELNEAGDKINISQAKLNTLTGGREGTASKMIEWLFGRRQTLSITGAPSDAQLDTLVEWFLCPDIPFDSLSITVEQPLKPGANLAESHTETVCIEKRIPAPSEKYPNAWRWMLPEEFKAELKAKLTRAQASKLISEKRGTFYDWKSSRITKAQMEHVRRLDKRLANIESQAEVTFGVDIDGNVEEVSTARKNTYNPCAHEPLTDMQLVQMSVEEAKTLIDQMHSELNETYASIDNSTAQQDLSDKVSAFSERTGSGMAKNINDARVREYTKLSDLIYKLEAVVGHANDELHDMIKETLIDNAGGSVRVTHKIREFMLLAIDYTSKEKAFKTSGALLQLTEDTEIGTKIAERVNNETQARYSAM